MDVFLVPVAPDRYELYCEEPDAPPPEAASPPSGFFRRMKQRFGEQLAEAERDRRRGGSAADAAPVSFSGRVKARMMRWVAESVAEQRLLWLLRGRRSVQLIYPDDLSDAQARQLLARTLNRDFERHRFWLVINSLGLIGTAVLVVLPGPNVFAYYFVFRIVGHFLSLRGARQGIIGIRWTVEASAPLAALRGLVSDSPEARAERVREVASSLRLEHLASFFQRIAIP